MNISKKQFISVVLVLLLSFAAFAIKLSGEAAVHLESTGEVKPTFKAKFDFGNFKLKASSGFVDFNDSFAFEEFKSLPSVAVSADLFTGGYEFSFRLLSFDFRYEKLLADLGSSRRFVAHRLKATKEGFPIYLDFFETSVIVGNDETIYFMYNPVPLLPVYLVQHLALKSRVVNNRDINVLMGFNTGYVFNSGAIIYVETIIDDFPFIPFTFNQLPVMGVSLGYSSEIFELSGAKVQFSAAALANTRYLHSHWGGHGRYTTGSEFLGDDLGPDALKLGGILNLRTGGFSSSLSLAYEWHGPGHLDEYWTTIGRDEAYKTFFLSEIVEKKLRAELAVGKSLTDSLQLQADLGVVYTTHKGKPATANFSGGVGLAVLF